MTEVLSCKGYRNRARGVDITFLCLRALGAKALEQTQMDDADKRSRAVSCPWGMHNQHSTRSEPAAIANRKLSVRQRSRCKLIIERGAKLLMTLFVSLTVRRRHRNVGYTDN